MRIRRVNRSAVRKGGAFVVSLAFALVVSGPVLVKYAPANAIALPFGGLAFAVTGCNTGVVVTIGPPLGGRLFYQPGTPTFLYGLVAVPSVWELGTRLPTPGVCFIGDHNPDRLPYDSVMEMVGTSL